MLGGEQVNVSGPCFQPPDTILCKFGDIVTNGIYQHLQRCRYVITYYRWGARFVMICHHPSSSGALFFAPLTHLPSSTVGCVWNFQNGGGSIKAIFQFKKLKFDMVLYFGLINSPTVAKKFSCKNGF